MQSLLTINAGSSSLKTALYRTAPFERLAVVKVANLGHEATLSFTTGGVRSAEALANVHTHDDALAAILERLAKQFGALDWRAFGHRVTHGGREFRKPQRIDETVRAQIAALSPLAPLHQPHNLAGIAAAVRLAPNALQVACFDTSFHRTIPDVARRYALPRALSDEGIEAFGFHGLSYEYIASTLGEHLGARADGRVIVAHLGSGASLCAMQARRSIATTMGFTPLDGLPMATRSGALDPGVLLHLIEAKKMSAGEIRDLLYTQSGLLGVSGISDSMKELLASAEPHAAEAIDLFVHRTVCAIGSLTAALGGLDTLVFTGGIGENSAEIRTRICSRVAWLGAELDTRAHREGRAVFSTSSSAVALCVLPTDEENVIARHTRALLE